MPGRRSRALAAPAIVWFGWLVLVAGANLATPLYGAVVSIGLLALAVSGAAWQARVAAG